LLVWNQYFDSNSLIHDKTFIIKKTMVWRFLAGKNSQTQQNKEATRALRAKVTLLLSIRFTSEEN